MIIGSLNNVGSDVPGTQGYVTDAESLIPRFESINPLEKYRAVAHLFPACRSAILDVGASTGVDAHWFAQQGHQVLAIEPVAAFREAGIRLHPSPDIAWLAESLPLLSGLARQETCFDVALVRAVWNHLAVTDRKLAMARLAGLLRPGGLLVLSLRFGASAANRRVFDVSVEETIRLATGCGLALVTNAPVASVQAHNREAGVTWVWLAFTKAGKLPATSTQE